MAQTDSRDDQRDDRPGKAATPGHDARRLTADGAVATIRPDQQVYTLRITRTDKLILTK